MPSKNTVKTYVVDGIYHVYNRGVEKRDIFLDERDYKVFLYYLKSYLLPPDHPSHKNLPRGVQRSLFNFNLYQRLELLAYCLVPNHFHFLLRQLDEVAMSEFIKRLCNAYVEYFNKKYNRVGSLFQGSYKAVLIEEENYFIHLSRYIHLNPLKTLKKPTTEDLVKYSYSSYPDYIGRRHTAWLKKEPITEYFKQGQRGDLDGFESYRDFVENYPVSAEEIVGEMILE